jgi:chromosome segregation ATPase
MKGHMNVSNEGTNNTMAELKDKLLGAKDEVEMLNNQLMIEKHKADALQQELEDLSREQAQEASLIIARQKEYDQRIAELNSTINRLQNQSSVKNSFSAGIINTLSSSDSEVQKLRNQVTSLSEDLIRQRSKLQLSSTEVQTLRNRLNSALSRAEIAEKAAMAQAYDLESSRLHTKEILKSREKMKVISVKSAFKLDTGRSEVREFIGKVIDTIDIMAVDMGSYFRRDPFARAVFLLYFMILHLWAFCLLIFHAHGTLEPAPDVGPEQLLQHSYRHYEQGGTR